MNFLLLDKIATSRNAVLATILETEGHTYKKAGAKALFVVDRPQPVHGNLGSLCADQEILREAKTALGEGRPRTLEIDTSEVEDIEFGYGAFCGGWMRLLLEPVTDEQRRVYKDVEARLQRRESARLVHDLDTGALSLAKTGAPDPTGAYTEIINPPRTVFLVGATPLCRSIARHLEDSDFLAHVVDWRPAHLDEFDVVPAERRHADSYPFGADDFVVVATHHYHRDRLALEAALSVRCRYIGLLSSRTRRERLYRELEEGGAAAEDIARIASPVGIDLGGRTDTEIAIGIVAQLIRCHNDDSGNTAGSR